MADERTAHEQLDCLVESLVENPMNPLSEQLKITDADLASYHILRVDFDIEAVPGPDSGILFNPLPQWKLDCHQLTVADMKDASALKRAGAYASTTNSGETQTVSLYPHLAIWTELHCNGHEGTLVYGEVAALISSIYARAVQRNIPEDRLEPEIQDGYMEEDELENFSANPALLKKFDLAFGEETQFPVLMVSCLGPQHGPLLYAHMDGSTLVIHQSKLYGFERRDTAPWDLFARWVLITPVS